MTYVLEKLISAWKDEELAEGGVGVSRESK